MAPDDGAKIPSPFDVRTIKYLVRLMSRHDLSEIDLREADLRIRLRRGPKGVTVHGSPAMLPPLPAAPTVQQPAPPTTNQEAGKPARALHEIKSPTPGTFYASPNPGADPFVRVGARVNPTTVVCIIEAMKIFNEITADCSGVVVEVVLDNQQPVEYGQVLFRVDPQG